MLDSIIDPIHATQKKTLAGKNRCKVKKELKIFTNVVPFRRVRDLHNAGRTSHLQHSTELHLGIPWSFRSIVLPKKSLFVGTQLLEISLSTMWKQDGILCICIVVCTSWTYHNVVVGWKHLSSIVVCRLWLVSIVCWMVTDEMRMVIMVIVT